MISNPRTFVAAVSLLWVTLLVGCAQQVPSTEVIGEVTMDGDPVSAAQVYLSPGSSARTGTGVFSTCIVDGVFEIPMTEGPPPGEYEVFIQPLEDDAEAVAEQLIKQKGRALAEREQFRSAVARQGPIRIVLAPDEINEVSIPLTTR